MDLEQSTPAMEMADDSGRKAASMRSVAPGENSRQMQQLLQGVRTAALSAALERSDDLERLARAIDAARERRVADGEDDR